MRLTKVEDSASQKCKSILQMRLMKVDDPAANKNKSALADHDGYHFVRESAGPSKDRGITEEQESLVAPQYLTMPRDIANAKNFSTILNGHEFLVDANGDLISGAALDRFIPQEYDGDLIHDDLTDDDRRLAAALVAVQLVNQQKQHTGTHILPLLSTALPVGSTKLENVENAVVEMPPLIGPNKGESASGATAGITTSGRTQAATSYAQGNSHILCSNSVETLPLLKKAIAKNKYLRDADSANSHVPLESLGLHQEIDDMALAIDDAEDDKSEIQYILPEEEKVEYLTEEDTVEVLDSDYDLTENNRRHSLPHKKRIARRLRQPKKTPVVRTKTPRKPNQTAGCTQTPSLAFSCELCFQTFNNQLKFFEHLKSHYEPETKVTICQQQPGFETSQAVVKSEMMTQQRVPKSEPGKVNANPSTTTVVRTAPVSLRGPSAMVRMNMPRTTTTLAKAPRPPVATQRTNVINPREMRGSGSVVVETLPGNRCSPAGGKLHDIINTAPSLLELELQGSVVQALWECQPCKRIFRRQKTFESHMAVAHEKEEPVEEFSDTEDMMEGIKVYVVSDEEKEGGASNVREVTTVQRQWYDEDDLPGDDFAESSETMKVELMTESENNGGQSPGSDQQRAKKVGAASLTCEICQLKFLSRKVLNQHLSDEHNTLINAITKVVRRQGGGTAKKGKLECKECGRLFHHRNSLVYHVRSHTGNRAFQCEVCGKAFFAKSALKVHKRQHTGVKPFKCEFCSRAFRQWGDLKYHVISIHSDQRNYQCEFCGKDFARKYSLTVHSRIHTGERNYKCDFCEKSFRAASYLQNHRRIHTGEKPHTCEICGKPFRVRSDMKRHLFTHKDTKEKGNARPKIEPSASNSNSVDSKFMTEVADDGHMSDIAKVEELEVSTVEGILSEETVRATDRLQEDLAFIPGDTQREPNTLYFWQVFPT